MIDSGPMSESFVDRLRQNPKILWVLIPAIVLNLWFDYYHPLGILIDIIIALVLLFNYLDSRRDA
jgi:hypothetical protein